MPIFEFKCSECGEVFDKLCRDRETTTIACKKCGKESHKQMGMTASPVFNGSGFYETDYKK